MEQINKKHEDVEISIIIPVYNCEKYLGQCLKSVMNQTIKNIEIICVNDGSTDNSVSVINEYSKQDSRIVLLNQLNQGPAKARNLGLSSAKGRYAAFLDADDYYLEPEALEMMYCACEENHVKAAGSLRKSLIDGMEKPESLFTDIFQQNAASAEQKTVLIKYTDYQIDYDYQSFLFDTALLIDNGIYFPDYLRFQDPPFLVKALYAAEKFAAVKTYLYCYRFFRAASRFDTSRTIDLIKGLIENLIFADEYHLDTLFQNTADRLEYEYANIICRNISCRDLTVIQLLLEANQIICRKLHNPKFILRPLQMILENTEAEHADYGNRILQKISKESTVCIYGAGKLAKKFLKYLDSARLKNKVSCMIVSGADTKESMTDGVPVVSVQNVKLQDKKQLVFVAAGFIYQKDMKNSLKENGFLRYQILDDIFLEQL